MSDIGTTGNAYELNFAINISDEIKPEEFHTLKHLPPLILDFQLPPDYPSDNPPQFTLSCKWLNRKQVADKVY